MATIEQFSQLELKVAKVVEAKAHPDADRLLVLTVDTGGVTKEIVSGIARHYTPAELVGKLVVVVNNMEPIVIRGVASNGMILCAQGEAGLSLVVPEKQVPAGSVVR